MSEPLISWPVGDGLQDLTIPGPGQKHLPRALLARWERGVEEWNAPPPVREALASLESPDTLVVITGQQPGIWGGPLYSLLKAASAIAVAERISEDLNRPAVAIFWAQGDDTDWDEVAWGTLPHRDLSLYKYRWHPAPIPARTWIGSAPVPRDPEEILTAWNREPRSLAGPAHDLSGAFIQNLLSMFGSHGLIPLDSRWPELRAGGRDLWDHYLQHHTPLCEAVLEHGEQLKNVGLRAPIENGAGDHGLFPLDGERRREIVPASWEGEVRELLAGGEPDRLAPSVLLRGLLQDYLFGTAAQVVGAVESAYLTQLKPVYQAFEITPPVRFPRLEATITPAGAWSHGHTAEVLADPEAWIGAKAKERLSKAPGADLDQLRKTIAESIQGVVNSQQNSAGDLGEVGESVRKRIEAQLSRLDQAALKKSRQALYRQSPWLRHLPEFLKPRRGPQDRGLSGDALGLFFGSGAADTVLAAARSHVAHARKQALHHFALEAPRE